MATQQSINTPTQREGESRLTTLSRACEHAWIVGKLLSNLVEAGPTHGVPLFAEQMLLAETALDGLRAQLDELDDDDLVEAQPFDRLAYLGATTFDAAGKVLGRLLVDLVGASAPTWSSSELAQMRAAIALCQATALDLDRNCGLGIWELHQPKAA